MKKLYIILPIVTMLIIASCQATPTPLDPASIQNTAVAMAWTSVAQTQTASTPQPTHVAATVPTKSSSSLEGNFEMSWNIYNSDYNSLGGILTIRKQGSKYTEKIVMSDGSSGTYDLTVISEGSVIKLSGHLGNPYSLYPHDYIQVESNGWLGFYDDQGYIYGVPPLK